jgi:hypothetical protein
MDLGTYSIIQPSELISNENLLSSQTPISDAYYNQDISLLIGNVEETQLPTNCQQFESGLLENSPYIALIEPETSSFDIDSLLKISPHIQKNSTITSKRKIKK